MFIARVFVALVRAAGIPARMVRGSLLGFPTETGSFEARTHNIGFGHQWAEVYAEPVGWFPVEFHSCVLQPPILTEYNTPSPERRAALLAEGEAAADYLFGSLDNQRVRCGTFEPDAAGLPVETTVTMRSLHDRQTARLGGSLSTDRFSHERARRDGEHDDRAADHRPRPG